MLLKNCQETELGNEERDCDLHRISLAYFTYIIVSTFTAARTTLTGNEMTVFFPLAT